MRKRHYLYILLALAVTAFLTTGCGSSGGSSSVSVDEPEAAPLSATLGTQYDAVISEVDMTENALGELYPTVTFRVTNAAGQPVTGLTDGLEFTIAKRVSAWQSYINRSRLQSGGVKVLRAAGERQPADAELGDGYYRYTFKTDLNEVNSFKYYGAPGYTTNPGTGQSGAFDPLVETASVAILAALDLTYDPALLHRIAIAARPSAVDGVLPYRFNAVADFTPNNLPAFDPATRLAKDRGHAMSCNSCHAPTSLSASGKPAMLLPNVHGNTRFDFALCVTCHNPNTYDSRSSANDAWVEISTRTMIKNIHAGNDRGRATNRGAFLVAEGGENPYLVDGREYTGLRYPQSMRNCSACHPADTPASRGDGTAALTPTHVGEITNVELISVGGSIKPKITFTVETAAGAPVSGIAGFEFTIAKLVGPGDGRNQDFWQSYINRSRLQGGGVKVLRAAGERASAIETATPGTYEYTFATDLAAVNTFKYYGAPGYTTNPVTGQSGELTSPAAQAVLASLDLTWDANAITRIGVSSRPGTQEVVANALTYPGTATSRYNAIVDFVPAALPQLETELVRQIATNESCGACHATPSSPALWFDKRNNAFGNVVHTNYRYDIDLCVMCHNANTYDSRGSSDTNWASLDMAIMMHKIHAGEEGYSVDGRPYEFIEDDYASMRYPLSITDCRACHTNPLAVDTRLAVERDAWKNNPSIEACGSCHTGFSPQAHFTDFSCATCHTPAGIEEPHSR